MHSWKSFHSSRVPDSKYRELLDRFEKTKTLKLGLKNAFRELSSKILFPLSKNLTSSRNSEKPKIHLFTSVNMEKNVGKIDKVLGVRIETVYNFRARDKLSVKALCFFYPVLGSFNFFQVFWRALSTVKELPFQAPTETVKVAYFYELEMHLGMQDIESKLRLR